MPPRPRIGWLAKFGMVAAIIAAIPACGGGHRAAQPYVAQRPVYTPQPVRPVRIGGYAGYNYGRRAPLPVAPAEDALEVR